ncbi:MAG: Txe/YoeB family addiction module toxin, partial [Desulfocapsaceae bacterium]|jgi:toxin YoeB|nr:Txe/YoeB family addiction module toxin [Desulfocapsaceae bacterium]
MKLVFSSQAWEDYLHWQSTDKKILIRVNSLIEQTSRNPFKGIGKPEPLKHALAGWWSRRTDSEHRMVYRLKDDRLEIAQLRYHY